MTMGISAGLTVRHDDAAPVHDTSRGKQDGMANVCQGRENTTAWGRDWAERGHGQGTTRAGQSNGTRGGPATGGESRGGDGAGIEDCRWVMWWQSGVAHILGA